MGCTGSKQSVKEQTAKPAADGTLLNTAADAGSAQKEGHCVLNSFYPEPSQCRVQHYCAKLEDVTKEWLGAAIDAEVVSFNTKVCEQGQCAFTVLLNDVVYGANVSDKPKSFALKMQGQTDAQRSMFSGLGHFTKEVFFYTQFAEKVPLKTPKVYGVWTDAKGSAAGKGQPVEWFNMLMEDMNENWKTFNPVVDGSHSNLQETEDMLMKARELHVQFFKDPQITEPPFSATGATFSLDSKRTYVGYSAPSWQPVRENLPKLAGMNETTPHGFPPHATELVQFYDEYLGDNGALALKFIDGLEKMFQSRPMTLNHGDFNCGNVWQNKASPTDYCFADWQMFEMAPIGLDVESMLITLGDGAKVTTLMDKYHAGLPPHIQSEYTREQLQEDFTGQVAAVALILPCIMAGQLDPTLTPADKFEFTWKILWPKAFYNIGHLFTDLKITEFARKLAGESPKPSAESPKPSAESPKPAPAVVQESAAPADVKKVTEDEVTIDQTVAETPKTTTWCC